MCWAGNLTDIPADYLPCDGRSLVRAAFARLFEAIGPAWGGDVAGNFNLPDLRGLFLRGVDGTAGRDPDSRERSFSRRGGNTGNNVGSVQEDALQEHRHQDPGHAHVDAGHTHVDSGHTHVDAGHGHVDAGHDHQASPERQGAEEGRDLNALRLGGGPNQ